MTPSRNFRLAWRLARRDWRGGELGILLAALVIAVAATAATQLFGERLARTMVDHAAEFIAGDLTLASHRRIPAAWVEKSQTLGLTHAASVEFPSVLMENEQILLAGIKAVSTAYPLRGELRTRAAETAAEQVEAGVPPAGTAWVEPRVLGTLGLTIGSSLTVGSAQFRIERILTHEPDRRGDLYSLSPRVLMNLADLPATQVIRPGSRVHYYDMFAGEDASVRRFKTWLKPQLQHGDRLLDVHEDRPEVGTALNRAERYLGMTSVMVVLIAGVAIGMSAWRYTERHADTTALLKCLGAGKNDILTIYALVLAIVGVPGAILGSVLGDLIQAGLARTVAGLLPHSLAQPGLEGLLVAPLMGLVILAGFAVPPLPGLMRVPPLRVLRRDRVPTPPGVWLSLGLAVAALGILLLRPARDPLLAALILGGGVLVLTGFRFCLGYILRRLPALMRRRPLVWRLGFHNLLRRPRLASFQIIGFGLAMAAMLVSYIVQNELVSEWKRQLPADAPNFFALNLQDTELDRFRQFLAAESIESSEFYPIVRGRLIQVDGTDVRLLAPKDSQAEAAIERDLSLTWSEAVPSGNRIVQGRWWSEGPLRVSVEEKLAGELGIRLGARLTFDVAGTQIEARVESLRSVRWDSMTPNFYVIFSPGSLQDQPRTYLTSFHVAQERTAVLNALVKAFPAMTLLDVDALLKQFQAILQQVTLAVEVVLGFAVVAGFTVLFGAVHATAEERMREDALLRAVGADASLLQTSQWIEFASLGFLAGILAVACAESVGAVVFSRVMNLTPHAHPWLWFVAPCLGALSVGFAGRWSAGRVVGTSPADVLRDLS
ncbi:ABC transporter permease [Methylococcus geothermalis]|uniref:FtsX-like permease family protein n=1 Tax=Methylococcus geothermalis TaxID=2681310 RepID=A0A858Q9I7_9GAMM|nr:FtsX-like permease family protein [Methylococcus geothermalis]QJD30517.1 FtsX-like permease family protein [Methylococcus geothermalis]